MCLEEECKAWTKFFVGTGVGEKKLVRYKGGMFVGRKYMVWVKDLKLLNKTLFLSGREG